MQVLQAQLTSVGKTVAHVSFTVHTALYVIIRVGVVIKRIAEYRMTTVYLHLVPSSLP